MPTDVIPDYLFPTFGWTGWSVILAGGLSISHIFCLSQPCWASNERKNMSMWKRSNETFCFHHHDVLFQGIRVLHPICPRGLCSYLCTSGIYVPNNWIYLFAFKSVLLYCVFRMYLEINPYESFSLCWLPVNFHNFQGRPENLIFSLPESLTASHSVAAIIAEFRNKIQDIAFPLSCPICRKTYKNFVA